MKAAKFFKGCFPLSILEYLDPNISNIFFSGNVTAILQQFYSNRILRKLVRLLTKSCCLL